MKKPETYSEILFYPPDPGQKGLNSEAEAEIDKMLEWVDEERRRRAQAVKDGVEVWADAYQSGGEDAAKEALIEHLRNLASPKK